MNTTKISLFDIVCGRGVRGSVHRVRLYQRDYYFCSESCCKLFRSNPALYLQTGPG
jgi:YHS domain-containing protein